MTTLPPMSGSVINNARPRGKQLFTWRWRAPTLRREVPSKASAPREAGHRGWEPRGVKKLLFPLNPNHWQWKTQPQFILEIDFHVMKAELLELNAAKIM